MNDSRSTRANAIADEIATHIMTVGGLVLEFTQELQSPAIDLVDLIKTKVPPGTFEDAKDAIFMLGDQIGLPVPNGHAMRAQIDALFESDGKKMRPEDEPAIEQVMIYLFGVLNPIQGTLVKTQTGLLKMGIMAQGPKGAVLVDHFFGYEDVVCIAVPREMKVDTSTLFTSH